MQLKNGKEYDILGQTNLLKLFYNQGDGDHLKIRHMDSFV